MTLFSKVAAPSIAKNARTGAGAEYARVFVIAIDDIEASVRTAEAVHRNYPHLKIIARARNRRHAHALIDLGIEHVFRETFLSSVSMSKRVLIGLGFDNDEVDAVGERFRTRDSRLLQEQHAFHLSEEKLIQSARDTAAEFDALLESDVRR